MSGSLVERVIKQAGDSALQASEGSPGTLLNKAGQLERRPTCGGVVYLNLRVIYVFFFFCGTLIDFAANCKARHSNMGLNSVREGG